MEINILKWVHSGMWDAMISILVKATDSTQNKDVKNLFTWSWIKAYLFCCEETFLLDAF